MPDRKKQEEKNSHRRKHRIVSVLLDDLISRIRPGEKLPGIRELMRLSGCGRPVVTAELKRCMEAKKISVRQRSGFFRSDFSGESRKIAILYYTAYPADGTNFADLLFDSLRALIERDSYEASFVNIAGRGSEFFRELAETLGTDKVILAGCSSAELAETARRIFRCCMELLPRHDVTLGAEVRDSAEMTIIQLNYLFQRNFRKIGYLHHVEKEYSRTPVEYHRLFDYYRIMAEHGLAVDPAWVFFAPWEWEDFERSMEKFFASSDLPEALIVPGSTLPFFYRFCGSRGIEIGREIGVMGCDVICPSLRPRVTTTTNDPGMIAEEAWQVMKALLVGSLLHRTTTLHVRPGDSIYPRSVSQKSLRQL